MRLTTFSDYSFRVLLYLAAAPDERATIVDMAQAYGISRNHLMKVVHLLGQLGYVETLRGKGGGIRLATPPASIRAGEVLRATEERFELAECMEDKGGACRIERVCKLKHALGDALAAFLKVLDGYTLADLAHPRSPLVKVLFKSA